MPSWAVDWVNCWWSHFNINDIGSAVLFCHGKHDFILYFASFRFLPYAITVFIDYKLLVDERKKGTEERPVCLFFFLCLFFLPDPSLSSVFQFYHFNSITILRLTFGNGLWCGRLTILLHFTYGTKKAWSPLSCVRDRGILPHVTDAVDTVDAIFVIQWWTKANYKSFDISQKHKYLTRTHHFPSLFHFSFCRLIVVSENPPIIFRK